MNRTWGIFFGISRRPSLRFPAAGRTYPGRQDPQTTPAQPWRPDSGPRRGWLRLPPLVGRASGCSSGSGRRRSCHRPGRTCCIIDSNTHFSVISIVENKDVHFAAVRCTGVQRDHPGAVVGTEIRIWPELGTLVFVPGVAVGTMPVATEDRLLFRVGLRCVHPVYPPRPAPFLGCGLTPIGAMAVTAVTLLDAGNPAVHENVMRGS